MPKHNVQFTKDNEYYTPKSVVDFFGKFDYDPATTKEKAEEFGITHYDTIETDGLTSDWNYGRIWCNPPFTAKHKFMQKAAETYGKYGNEIYLLFPLEFITTKRFREAMRGVGGGILRTEWTHKIREWSWQKIKEPSVRKCGHEDTGRMGNQFCRH